jgi:hypothetical protein
MAKFKVGDKFIIHKCKKNKKHVEQTSGLVIGKLYEVQISCGNLYFTDDDGDYRWINDLDGCLKFTKIVD